MNFRLTIQGKDGREGDFSIEKPVTYIGRIKDNDVILNDSHVSKRHAKIILSKGLLEILDLGSTNGTMVNGEGIDHRFLRNGDRIQVGNTALTVHIHSDDDENEAFSTDKTVIFSRTEEAGPFDFDSLQSELQFHFEVIRSCTIVRKDGKRVLLATRPDSRYPYFYPRDGACAARLFRKYAVSDFSFSGESYMLLKDMAYFLREVQREDGYWGQRYSAEGGDESIYRQEDNIAHAIAAICNYLLSAHELGKEVDCLEGLLDAINRGCLHALKHYYRNEIHLFFSTTSVHESALEQGFSCWVNFAYLYALTLVYQVCEKMDLHHLISGDAYDIRPVIQRNLFEILSENGRFIRRIDARGRSDYRPDVTLMSPFYFGFQSYHNEDIVENTMNVVKRQLWDPELGLLQRYLPFAKDQDVHIHAGNGSWLNFSAILAQYYFHTGDTETGDMILSLINRFRNRAGEIPEHVSTLRRFRDFLKKEWDTGLDFEKEFDKAILVHDIRFEKILKEAQKMFLAYQEVEEKAAYEDKDMAGEGYIQFCTPLMWSHVEFSKALLARNHQTVFARDHTQIIRKRP